MGPDLVRMANAAGDHRARRVGHRGARAQRSPGAAPRTAKGLALRCRGLLDDDVDALLAAVAAHREGPRPVPAGRRLRGRRGCPWARRPSERGGPALERGDGHLRAAPRRWDVARVQSRRSAPSGSDGPARLVGPTFGWDSLTPTEVRVVELVAEGMTNPEIAERLFVSRRTVATHVEHVFQKLGHANRVELAADAARRVASEERTPSAASAPGAAPASPRRPSSRPSGRLTRPAGGSNASSRIVISTG